MPKKPVTFKGIQFSSTAQARDAVMLDMLGYELKEKSGFIYVEHPYGPIVLYDDWKLKKRAYRIFSLHAYFSRRIIFFHNSENPVFETRLRFYEMCEEKGFKFTEVLKAGKKYKFTPQ